jgi:hypothetical protein
MVQHDDVAALVALGDAVRETSQYSYEQFCTKLFECIERTPEQHRIRDTVKPFTDALVVCARRRRVRPR